MPPWADVRVACREEHRSREKPIAVEIDGQRLEVIDIVDRWYEQGPESGSQTVNYFKVVLTDGRTALLRYVPLFDRWAVRLDRPPRAGR